MAELWPMAVLRENACVSSPKAISQVRHQVDTVILVKVPVQLMLADPPGLWLVLAGWMGLVQLLAVTGTQAGNATKTTILR